MRDPLASRKLQYLKPFKVSGIDQVYFAYHRHGFLTCSLLYPFTVSLPIIHNITDITAMPGILSSKK